MPIRRTLKYIVLLLTIIFVSFPFFNGLDSKAEGTGKLVYVIPIEQEVERGLVAFLERTTTEAIEANADHIIFEIDTPGGRVDSAGDIAELLQGIEIPTTSFIVNRALSAGSYIALNTNNIYFQPQATMGASGVITGDGNAADGKARSAWLASMRSAAESQGRDPQYAAAMADETIDMSEYGAPEGEFLTLGPTEALEIGYAEGVVNHRTELLAELDLTDATIMENEPTFAEGVARFLTSPTVIPILLSVASIGLVVELYSPGFGVPGSMGIIALLLFFYGHVVAGLAGMEAILLLVIGIALIIAEFFVSSGILALIGVGSIIGALFMSGYDMGHMAMSISIAFIVAVILAVVLYRTIGFDKGIFRHIVLRDQTQTELGYVSSENRLELIGLEGEALTNLRPAGVAKFNEEQLDVVSEGTYIDKGKNIKVIKVEGVRIVVREI